MSTVNAVFADEGAALHAVDALHRAGLGFDRLSLVEIDRTLPPPIPDEAAEEAKGAVSGIPVGGIVGAVAGSVVVGASLLATGAGLVAAGAILALLAAAAAGGMAGGVTGALVGSGIREHRAHAVTRAMREGSTFVAVHVKTEEVREAERILEANGGFPAGASEDDTTDVDPGASA